MSNDEYTVHILDHDAKTGSWLTFIRIPTSITDREAHKVAVSLIQATYPAPNLLDDDDDTYFKKVSSMLDGRIAISRAIGNRAEGMTAFEALIANVNILAEHNRNRRVTYLPMSMSSAPSITVGTD